MIRYLQLAAIRLRARRWLRDRSIFFHDYSELEAPGVSRESYLLEISRGKRVLHFGFVDAPFTRERIESGDLLHLKIRDVAESAVGVDIDEDGISVYENLTGDRTTITVDLHNPDEKRADLSGDFDLLLYGEVLEHLANPGAALAALRRIALWNPGSALCVTVPNAFSSLGFMAAVQGHEIVHPEHYYYFSPKTLTNLLVDSGFADVQLKTYASGFTRKSPGLTKNGLIALCAPAGQTTALPDDP